MIQRTGFRLALVVLVVLFMAAQGPVSAQVELQVGDQPRRVLDSGPSVAAEAHDLFSHRKAQEGIALPPVFLPRFRVDTLGFSDTTLWSARNYLGLPSSLKVTYFTVGGVEQTVSNFSIDPFEVVSVNIRDIPGLAVDGTGEATGYVEFLSSGLLSYDAFQVDVSQDFASAPSIVGITEFCTNWSSRFIEFTPGESSILTFFVNGPQGTDPGDPATVTGTVFDEAGNTIVGFSIFTDLDSFTLDTSTIVPGSLKAGALGLVIDSRFSPDGYVSVEHKAAGKFSVSLPAACTDVIVE